jgi:hypothetical protein
MFARISASRIHNNPICGFAGGHLPHTILSSCQGTFLSMFSTKTILPLRSVCKDIKTVIEQHPWEDKNTIIFKISAWKVCFPKARVAKVCNSSRNRKEFKFLIGIYALYLTNGIISNESLEIMKIIPKLYIYDKEFKI